MAGPCAAMLAAAWSLTPDARGYGTAQQLGLPACGILVRTGWPCPTCGLTTSVAAAVRGRLGEALRAHAFGVLLTAAALVLVPLGLAELVTGRDVLGFLRPGWWWLALGGAGLLAGWGAKWLSGAAAGTLPLG